MSLFDAIWNVSLLVGAAYVMGRWFDWWVLFYAVAMSIEIVDALAGLPDAVNGFGSLCLLVGFVLVVWEWSQLVSTWINMRRASKVEEHSKDVTS